MVILHIACVTFFDSCWKSIRVLFGLLPAQVVTYYPLLLLFNSCIVDSTAVQNVSLQFLPQPTWVQGLRGVFVLTEAMISSLIFSPLAYISPHL